MTPPLVPALAACILLVGANACAQELTFVGRKPELLDQRKLHVTKGVTPDVPVVFDASKPDRLTLRPASAIERSNADRAVYRFEWQQDKSIIFYELIDPATLERLDRQNTKDSATSDGRTYERRVLDVFFAGGEVLRECVYLSPESRVSITAYITVSASGRQEQVTVLPEGSVAQCLLRVTKDRAYPPTRGGPFVAKGIVNVGQ